MKNLKMKKKVFASGDMTLEKYAEMPVRKAVMKNAVPAMLSMLMTLLYSLADIFFIGQIHDDYQVAAAALCLPVVALFMSIGTLFGVGGLSVISRALGEGRPVYAKKVCAFCLWAGVVCGVMLAVLFLLFMEPLLIVLGASTDTLVHTRTYLEIVTWSGPFVVMSNCCMHVLRSEGAAKQAMMGQILGNALNIVLDPVLIMVFHLNIMGAALATIIGNVVGALYYLSYYIRGRSVLSIHWKDVSLKESIPGNVLAIGVPAALTSVLMSVSQIVMNGLMVRYGDMALAGIGIAMKVTMITGMVSIGIGQGVQPLLGFCVGAKRWKRYRKTMSVSLWFAFLFCSSLTVLCYLFTRRLVGAFLTETEAVQYGVRFARILLISSPIFGVLYVLSSALQAINAAKSSLIIGLSRQGLIYIPVLYVFHSLIGAPGLVWAQPVSDGITLLISVVLYVWVLKKIIQGSTKTPSINDHGKKVENENL